MGLFTKKCEYCGEKIEKGKEIKETVPVPGKIGTVPRFFCSKNHVEKYKKSVEDYLKKQKTRHGCC